MKVLQVLPSLCAGGAEGFVVNLCVDLAKHGTDVRFFLLGGVRGKRGEVLLARLQEADIEVIGVQERKSATFRNLVQLMRLILSWRPDIVQANLYAAEVACAVIKMLTGGLGACFVRRLAGTDICGHRPRWIVKRLDPFFRLTVACSLSVAEAFRILMGEKIHSEVVTITNGGVLLDSPPDAKEKRQARLMLNIPEQAFVVAHVGRMMGGALGSGLESEPKAQDVLLQAFAQAFGGDPGNLLVLVGDGVLRPKLEALARQLNIAGQTRFLGECPEPWTALKSADAFCFPSRHEGLPNALVEAASCGLPVAASDISPIRAIYPGDAWVLVPVDDISGFAEALLRLRRELVPLTNRAGEVAKGFTEAFSMRSCAEKYEEAYRSALPIAGKK